MLTKEHLRYRWEDGNIIPSFLGATPFWTRHADEVLKASQTCVGQSYAELEKELNVCLALAGRSKRAVKGLCSVLEKKIELEPIDEGNVESEREAAWSRQVAKLRAVPEPPPYPAQPDVMYPDLMIRRCVASTPHWSPERFLHRYNLALVQGLLLHAEEVYLEFDGMSAQGARAFGRYLKFFGLLVDAKGRPGERCSFHIGGALSELGGAQRYKMRMASMFGALPHFSQWRCRAKLNLEKKKGILDLRQDSGLSSHYRPHQDYIPPELGVFVAKLEDALGADWSSHQCSWPEVPLEQWIFPDLIYRRKDGYTLAIDFFFNHQKSSFLRRLSKDLIAEKKQWNRVLILAERRCAEGAVIQCPMDDVLLFNGIPSVSKVSGWLNKGEKKS